MEWDQSLADENSVKFNGPTKVQKLAEGGSFFSVRTKTKITPETGPQTWRIRVTGIYNECCRAPQLGVMSESCTDFSSSFDRVFRDMWVMSGFGGWFMNVANAQSPSSDGSRFNEGEVVTFTFDPATLLLSIDIPNRWSSSAELRGCNGSVYPCVHFTGKNQSVEIL